MTSTEPETSDNNKKPSQTGLNSPRSVKILQVAVVAMGIVLVIGLITVMSRILYLYFGAGNSGLTTSQSVPADTAMTLSLPQGAKVTTMSLSQDRLAIHFNAPTGNGIRILNVATGAIENSIHIGTEAPKLPSVPTN